MVSKHKSLNSTLKRAINQEWQFLLSALVPQSLTGGGQALFYLNMTCLRRENKIVTHGRQRGGTWERGAGKRTGGRSRYWGRQERGLRSYWVKMSSRLTNQNFRVLTQLCNINSKITYHPAAKHIWQCCSVFSIYLSTTLFKTNNVKTQSTTFCKKNSSGLYNFNIAEKLYSTFLMLEVNFMTNQVFLRHLDFALSIVSVSYIFSFPYIFFLYLLPSSFSFFFEGKGQGLM